jgi:hypothetical protein
VPQPTSRFWDAFWIVVPLIIGVAVGIYFAGQFPGSTIDCTQAPAAAPSTTTNYVLAVVLVVLLVGRIVARSTIGPVAGRVFTMAAIGLVVSACGSYFVTARSEPCPTAAIASRDATVVRISHAVVLVPRHRAEKAL